MSSKHPLTYTAAGADYGPVDAFKRAAQKAALETTHTLAAHGIAEVPESRGDSAYVLALSRKSRKHSHLAHVEEALGTKHLVADALEEATGRTYYDVIAQDTVAMIVNDLIVSGLLPVSIAMHLSAGDPNWFQNTKRWKALVRGWKRACVLSQAVWGPGETPIPDTSYGTFHLSGSALGIGSYLTRNGPRIGDSIVLIESSGIHANGLTLARAVAEKIPGKYTALLPTGITYGEALLKPTHIYVPLVAACIKRKVPLQYMVNITGHGWRKLMRFQKPYQYDIHTLPPVPPLFSFMASHGPIEEKEMYGTFNMGAGFALFTKGASHVAAIIALAKEQKLKAWNAGTVHASRSGHRSVHLQPLNIQFEEESLRIR
jgi:phosphoribosylformylglycinamidine cyclo-ligase